MLYVQIKDSNDLVTYDSKLNEVNRIAGYPDEAGKLD